MENPDEADVQKAITAFRRDDGQKTGVQTADPWILAFRGEVDSKKDFDPCIAVDANDSLVGCVEWTGPGVAMHLICNSDHEHPNCEIQCTIRPSSPDGTFDAKKAPYDASFKIYKDNVDIRPAKGVIIKRVVMDSSQVRPIARNRMIFLSIIMSIDLLTSTLI